MKQIFVPLTKVDAEQRLVYGTAAVEQLDKSGEIFDYATSRPLFEKWSSDIEALSLPAVQAFGENARSHGNLREMHGKSAAGKLAQPLGFDDLNKTIEVCAKVTDDKAWAKVQDGVYTGFSIGGDYEKVWEDSTVKVGTKAAKRYTANPSELSLVDNPCIPGATFSFVKSDGSSELRKFSTVELAAEDIPGALYKVCEGLAWASEADAPKGAAANEHERAMRVMKRAKELNVDASGFARAYIEVHGGEVGAQLMKVLPPPLSKKVKYLVTDSDGTHLPYTDSEGKPDHRLMGAAWAALHGGYRGNKYEGSGKSAAISRLKGIYEKEGMKTPSEKFATGELSKSLYDVSTLAGLLMQLNYCQSSLEIEADMEGDGSAIPGRLKGAVQLLSQILVDLATEETDELTAAKAASDQIGKDTNQMKKFFETHSAAIEKAAGDATNPELQKMATHLKEIGKHVDGIQKAHDTMGEHLDALNPKDDKADDDGADEKATEKAVGATLRKAYDSKIEGLEKAQKETGEQIKNLVTVVTKFMQTTPAGSRVAQNDQGIAIEKVNDGKAKPEVIDPKDPEAAMKVMKGIHAGGATLLKS